MKVANEKAFVMIKNKHVFSLVGELIAVAILFILIGTSLFLINYSRRQTKLLEEEMNRNVSADNIKKAFNLKNSCSDLFVSGQTVDITQPTLLQVSPTSSVVTSESFQIQTSTWLLINTNMTAHTKTYRSDLDISFINAPTKKKFIGPLFITLDFDNKFVTCFAEYSKEEKCQMLDGVYDTSIQRCKLSPAACPKGSFMVSAGVQKWVCK